MGPTAAGKSEIAVAIAEDLHGEVVSVDSMQVYRGMDIGTAKPGPHERARVPHHLLDLVEPEEIFSVARFQREGRQVLAGLREQGRPAVIVGGSGLHFRALVDPLRFAPTDPTLRRELEELEPMAAQAVLRAADPGAGSHVDLRNPRRVVRALEVLRLTGATPSQRAGSREAREVRRYRPRLAFSAVGIDPGELLEARVEDRLEEMMAAGLLEEVAALVDRLGPTARQAVGYKELLPVVRGKASLEEGLAGACRATLELARRQRTYFRRDPRIHWIAWSPDPDQRREAVRLALEEAGFSR
ncbi:MAG: tRNA (adenosine(37)-N6)-dimethylallyltransferase MiaA [Actinomycetota bacterium]|nr:tRNA (adenosine(37)-N6)-dimethylallyltransferase MiaA [Actinomycetota bacterium]